MKQIKLLLVLIALGLVFLFVVQEVQSTEVTTEDKSLEHKKAKRLESEEGICL